MDFTMIKPVSVIVKNENTYYIFIYVVFVCIFCLFIFVVYYLFRLIARAI